MRCRLMEHLLPCALAWGALACTSTYAQCPPEGWPKAELLRLKADNWKLPDASQRQTFSLALLPCLGDPDPSLRDGIAFEALSSLLRGKQLTPATQLTIYQSQWDQLQPTAKDPAGFAKPFAALVLSELARADRITPFLSVDQRSKLVDAGTLYLRSTSDYRGFAAGEGWRHAVAHGADLMLQLALNPAIDAGQLERILLAVQAQVAPAGEHFYVYGEGDRLARPVLYAARRGLLGADFWARYVATLASPVPLLPTWEDAFSSQAGLARLHNVKAFLRALDAGVRASGDATMQATFETALPLALKGLP